MNSRDAFAAAAVAAAILVPPLHGQGFGSSKTKVTLQRKLPALMRLPGNTIRVRASGHANEADIAQDLQAQLETELLKDDSSLQEDEEHPATTITCQITNYAHPQPILEQKPNVFAGKSGPKTVNYIRVTGSLSVAFQARSADGHMVGSDNVTVNYDQEFDSSGNNTSHGLVGSMSGSWHKMMHGANSESPNDQPPTEAELRSHLLTMAVHRMAEQIVNTNESIDVLLAKDKGLEEGDKQAEAGLWQRAQETFETATPSPNRAEDAYRLYNTGVAYEALGYQASDTKSAMKLLDQAAINYGKAIDAKPDEKYFLEPQKRIETALAHYRKLEEEKAAPPAAAPVRQVAAATPPSAPSAPAAHAGDPPAVSPTHVLTNSKVIAMARAGLDDDSIAAAVRTAKAADFDLSSVGQRQLAHGGVDAAVISAMKARAARDLASGK
ncbi:MAG TPA: hypothetical protein VJS11_14035 [Acidobacteriaceae bacterium]|nr:hypothetical protein [Acidobacteriaceae bacterium]